MKTKPLSLKDAVKKYGLDQKLKLPHWKSGHYFIPRRLKTGEAHIFVGFDQNGKPEMWGAEGDAAGWQLAND